MVRASILMKSLWDIIKKIINYRPNPYAIAISLMISAIFLLGGGIYDLSVSDISFGSILYPYPRLDSQFLGESIIIMISYALGAAGLILMYWSVRYRRNPRQASLLIQLGIALLLIIFIITEVILYWWKIGYRL
ncbi:MAG: hypothetical protein QXX94_00820 [Candidatus Bathyarchaeia archaeon]